jgi:GxxExxY protein
MEVHRRNTYEPDPELDLLARAVIGAAIEVHKVLGPGYLESIYEASLCTELEFREIAFVNQHPMTVLYKGRYVGEGRLDILVENCLIVELKAVEALLPLHTAQVMSYLKALQLHLGLLINFNTPVLKQGIKRIVLS